jgi:omega-amidase
MLSVAALQSDLHWQDLTKNQEMFALQIAEAAKTSKIILLPEMFTTGFSMQAEQLAETMQGSTIEWMRNLAVQHKVIIGGSLIIKDGGHFFNRFIWMQPDGKYYQYDKRHLFSYAQEDKHYTAGNSRIIVQAAGIKFAIQICYDLRFPVWSRQSEDYNYDVLVYVANWPQLRIAAWDALLKARAIENQSYVIGVNRVGTDGNGNYYNGSSAVIDFAGNVLQHAVDAPAILHSQIDLEPLIQFRTKFAFLNDKDGYTILP